MQLQDIENTRTGWTLVRTIIGIDVAYVVHDSGEGSHLFSCGIGIGSREAVSISGGVPDAQTPGDYPERGWIFRAQYRIWGFAADQPQYMTRRVEKDIRAKRKLDNGRAYFTAISTLEEGAASTLAVNGLIRQYWLV